jgi:hypothetical protein
MPQLSSMLPPRTVGLSKCPLPHRMSSRISDDYCDCIGGCMHEKIPSHLLERLTRLRTPFLLSCRAFKSTSSSWYPIRTSRHIYLSPPSLIRSSSHHSTDSSDELFTAACSGADSATFTCADPLLPMTLPSSKVRMHA